MQNAARRLPPPTPFDGPHQIKAVDRKRGVTFRAIWNRVYPRPISEHFHEFLILILYLTLGRGWVRHQLSLPPEDRHAIGKWISEWKELGRRTMPPDAPPGHVVAATPTGYAKEAIMLARDIYMLQLVRRLPGRLRKRLKNAREFQGARYEIAIAAALVLSGFEIEWLQNDDALHCEFYATHKVTGETMAVETKSRHRKGTLNEPGTFDPTEAEADVERLFNEAIKQRPADRPFIIFIDVNLPIDSSQQDAWDNWGRRVFRLADQYGQDGLHQAPFTIAVFTNLSWHHAGETEVSDATWCVQRIPMFPEHYLKDRVTAEAIMIGLGKAMLIPQDAPEAPSYP